MEQFSNEFTTNFYLIDAANSGVSMIRVFTENTGGFILMVCWVYREEMEFNVQMGRWHVTVLYHSICSSIACKPSAIAT